jgi:hypothetical protein
MDSSADSDKLESLKITVDRIYTLLAGDEQLRQTGLIATVQSQGRRIGRLEWIGSYCAAIGSIIIVGYKIAVDWLRK